MTCCGAGQQKRVQRAGSPACRAGLVDARRAAGRLIVACLPASTVGYQLIARASTFEAAGAYVFADCTMDGFECRIGSVRSDG